MEGSHARRSGSSIMPQNIITVQDLIESDRHLTVVEIGEELEISIGSVHSIIQNQLEF